MESAHKPVIIAPLKRTNKKPRHKGCGNSVPSNIRRIHSQDIVTRIPPPRDDLILSDKQFHSTTSVKSPESPFIKHRSVSQDAITVRAATSSSEEAAEIGINCASIRECVEDRNSADVELEQLSSGNSTNDTVNISSSSRLNKTLEEAIQCEVEELCALNSANSNCDEHYLTLTGTIKRGKKAGQSIGVKLNMSREELEKLEADLSEKLRPKSQLFGTKSGIHILLLTLFCAPLVFLISGVYGFYLGTYTWYNIYVHFSDERTVWHKIFICPFLVLSYPLWVPPMFVGIGVFAAAVQISWYYDRWVAEVQDLEKGFFGWMCASLRLCECSPYEVIILNDLAAGKDGKITETTML